MDLGLKGKSVLVTAASKGLGKASALEFAREGATVTIASRNEELLRQAAEEIKLETGQSVTAVKLDVTNPKQIQQAVERAVQAGGGLDVLVTNAGGPPSGSFEEFDDEAWVQAFNLNLMSVIRLIRAALPHLKQSGAGRIINLTSVSVKQPLGDLILSNTIRAGVHALTKSLSIELAPYQILVNSVAPGRIASDRIIQLDENRAKQTGKSMEEVRQERLEEIPLGRYGEPEEFGKAVAFLGSYANTYITGHALFVDGGMVKAL